MEKCECRRLFCQKSHSLTFPSRGLRVKKTCPNLQNSCSCIDVGRSGTPSWKAVVRVPDRSESVGLRRSSKSLEDMNLSHRKCDTTGANVGNLLMTTLTASTAAAPSGTKESRMGDDSLNSEMERYVQELTTHQSRLRGYILAALGNYANSADVLQRTNLKLWKKAGEFRPGAAFLPWAMAIARYEILSFLRDHQRDRLVFSEDVAMLLMDSAESELGDPGDRQSALRKCMERLPKRSRELLWFRYDEGKSIKQIAEESDRTQDSVKCLLLRVRKSLEKCIEAKLRLDTV